MSRAARRWWRRRGVGLVAALTCGIGWRTEAERAVLPMQNAPDDLYAEACKQLGRATDDPESADIAVPSKARSVGTSPHPRYVRSRPRIIRGGYGRVLNGPWLRQNAWTRGTSTTTFLSSLMPARAMASELGNRSARRTRFPSVIARSGFSHSQGRNRSPSSGAFVGLLPPTSQRSIGYRFAA